MRLPFVVICFGYAGLVPFLFAPAWLWLAPGSAPQWLDTVWLSWCALVAAFMSGTMWGFALPACEGAEGKAGLLFSMAPMLLVWLATALPLRPALAVLTITYLLLLAADFWRERTLGTVGGYFALRVTLTIGVLIAIAWRYALSA